MKNGNHIRPVLYFTCFILLCIYIFVTSSEWMINWSVVTNVFLGTYFYSIYCLLGIMAGKPWNQVQQYYRRQSI